MFDREFNFVASSKEHLIYAYVWLPKEPENAKGVVQISHGMLEHAGRYDRFARFLADNGYICCANDHAGHGRSLDGARTFGFFAERSGPDHLVNDMFKLTKKMKEIYPGLPYYVFGHSMGSFIARLYVLKHGKGLSGAVYSGTSAGTNRDGFLVLFCKTMAFASGAKSKSKFIGKEKDRNYNKSIAPITVSGKWQTSDAKELESFQKDPLCSFVYTYSAYRDVLFMMREMNRNSWFKNAPDIPTFIFSGAKDPVGGMGIGVMSFYMKMKRHGFTDVTVRIYENGRHEMLNEVNRGDVHRDVLNWIETGAVDINPGQ